MLNDDDARVLRELERQLSLRDPRHCPFPTVPVLCVLLFLAVPMVSLLFGGAGLLVTCAVFAISVSTVLFRRSRRQIRRFDR